MVGDDLHKASGPSHDTTLEANYKEMQPLKYEEESIDSDHEDARKEDIVNVEAILRQHELL